MVATTVADVMVGILVLVILCAICKGVRRRDGVTSGRAIYLLFWRGPYFLKIYVVRTTATAHLGEDIIAKMRPPAAADVITGDTSCGCRR